MKLTYLKNNVIIYLEKGVIDINRYNKVPTLKILYALKNHQENEIIYCEENSKLYHWVDNTWTPLKIENQGLEINLYDLNKNIINQLEPFSTNDLSLKMPLFEEFLCKTHNVHYMLLCAEYHYYTIFESNSSISLSGSTFGGAICSILLSLGDIYSIERTNDGIAIEIWIKPEDKSEPMAFYLFPYDSGVIYYG